MPCDQHVHAANSGVHAFHYLQPLVGVVHVKWLPVMKYLVNVTWSREFTSLTTIAWMLHWAVNQRTMDLGILRGQLFKKKERQCFLAFCEGAFEMWQALLAHYDEIQSLDGPSLKNAAFMS